MVCRLWRGWTRRSDAHAYNAYLNHELFPRLHRELTSEGYRGFHVIRRAAGAEVEFVTLVWFESLDAVKSFAGEEYELPVLTDKARALLTHYAERCEHYDLTGFQWQVK